MPKIIHFRKDCIGCNSCVEYASNHWEMKEEDGKSVLKGGIEKKGIYQKDIEDFEVEENLEASKNCPMRIIQVLDEKGKELK